MISFLEQMRNLAGRMTQGDWDMSGARSKLSFPGAKYSFDVHNIFAPDDKNETILVVFYEPKHHLKHFSDAKGVVAAMRLFKYITSEEATKELDNDTLELLARRSAGERI